MSLLMPWYCIWLSQPSTSVKLEELCGWLLLAVMLWRRKKPFHTPLLCTLKGFTAFITESYSLSLEFVLFLNCKLIAKSKRVFFCVRSCSIQHKYLSSSSYGREREQPVSLYSQMLLSALQQVHTRLSERKITDTNLHNEGKFCGGHLQSLEFEISAKAKAKAEISNGACEWWRCVR